jgi:photosystem II stability/assembly factor-like uncharacterized protein
MSNQLTCNDPFGYSPGLEDGNSSGPSPVSNSNTFLWYSNNGDIVQVSKSITIDSVFASFTLNQQGGNYSTSGYLYEIWFNDFVNNGNDGNVLNGGHWLFLTNGLTLDCYDLVIVDTQDVNDPTHGNITKVLVADPAYSEELSKYVDSIQVGEQLYYISTTPLTEYANKGVFRLDNNIKRKVNFNSKDLSRIIDQPLLSYSSNESLWINSPESVLSYPQLSEGNSLRLQKNDNRDSGFEVVINGTPTYRGQINDVTPGDVYYSIFFVNPTLGFTVGTDNEGSPVILRTLDGGASWLLVTPVEMKITPKAVAFITTPNILSMYTGYTVGNSGTIFKTVDSGETWQELESNSDENLHGISIYDENNIWVVGANGEIIHGTSDGTFWSPQISGVSADLNSVFFVDDMTGWAVGDSGTVVETEDGGLTWADKTSVSGTTEDLYGVFFTSLTRGYACGSAGTIIRTNTDGDSWTTRNSGTTNDLRSVYFIGDTGICVGSSGSLTKTTDGGITWNASGISGYGSLYSVQMLSTTNIWSSGDDTYIKKTTNGGSSWTSSVPPNTPLNLVKAKIGQKVRLSLVFPYQFNYKKGDVVYVSKQMIDVKSGNYGIEYLKGVVLSFSNGILDLMVSFKPSGASASGSKWYIISEVNQINIPISSNYYLSLLDQSEILEYNLLNSVFSVRLQIEDNKAFNRYVFRYKPDNSSSWKYVETTESNTVIDNILPNTIFDEQIMGFNDSTGDYCGFSDSGTFNTFF